MYNGLGRAPASSSWSTVGIDMGGSGMEGGIGDGSGGSGASALLLLVAFEPVGAATVRPFRSRGWGRGAGLNEFRRVGRDCVGCWPLDLRRLVGGVETVLETRVGLPVWTTRGLVPSDRSISASSRLSAVAEAS